MKSEKGKCLLCGNLANLVYDKYTGYQHPQKFKIFSCTFCNTNFSIPRMDASRLYDIIYSQKENHPAYDRYWKYAREVKGTIDPLDYLAKSEPTYFGVVEFLNKMKISKNKRILEIGSGLGYLTYALRKSGYNANAIELSMVAVAEAIQNFGDHYENADLFDYSAKNQSSFDVVVCTEVIEHIENPIDFIKAMINLLNPGGYLVLTTPNKSFFPKKMVWESSLPPIHCWWFSEDSMKYVARVLNASVKFVGFRKYFTKKNKLVWSVSSCENSPLPRAILDENDSIIVRDNIIDEIKDKAPVIPSFSTIIIVKKLIKTIPKIEYIIKYIRKYFLKTEIVAGKKCHYMCAVFRK